MRLTEKLMLRMAVNTVILTVLTAINCQRLLHSGRPQCISVVFQVTTPGGAQEEKTVNQS